MSCNVETEEGVLSFVSLEEIIQAALVDVYDDQQINYERFEHWVVRGWRELNMFLLKDVKKVFLPVDPTTNTVSLPPDYKGYAFIGYVDNGGMRIPLSFNPDIANSLNKPGCDCKCGCKNPCKEVKYEKSSEHIIINSVPYTNTVVRMILEDKYVEETTLHVPVYENVSGVKTITSVTTEKTVKELCRLDVKPCGCLASTESNVRNLSACGCSSFCNKCCQDEEFNIFPKERIVQLRSGIKKMYLEYYGDLPCVNGVYYVPEIAFETLVAFLKHMRIEDKPGISTVEKTRKYNNFIAARKNLRKLKNRTTVSRLLNILSMQPNFGITDFHCSHHLRHER